jgi:hypothetical protein
MQSLSLLEPETESSLGHKLHPEAQSRREPVYDCSGYVIHKLLILVVSSFSRASRLINIKSSGL